jgi:hypothetical protein
MFLHTKGKWDKNGILYQLILIDKLVNHNYVLVNERYNSFLEIRTEATIEEICTRVHGMLCNMITYDFISILSLNNKSMVGWISYSSMGDANDVIHLDRLGSHLSILCHRAETNLVEQLNNKERKLYPFAKSLFNLNLFNKGKCCIVNEYLNCKLIITTHQRFKYGEVLIIEVTDN